MLPADIIEIENLCYRSMVRNPPNLPRSSFTAKLLIVTENYSNLDDEKINDILLRCWMTYAELIAFEVMVPDAYHKHIDRFFSLLAQKKLVTKTIDNPDYARTLACLLMTRVLIAEQGYPHPPNQFVGEIMSQWSGVKLNEADVNLLKNFISSVYGAGAWELFSTDVTEEDRLPRHFANLNLAMLTPLVNNDVYNINNTHLPTDIS